MSKFRFPCLVSGLLTVVVMMGASPVRGVQVSAGWTRADVGLQNEGDGFFVGVGNDIPMASCVFDASYALEYVQKAGSQPTLFSDPVTGLTVADAEVILHCVQPSLFLGARVPGLGFVPRIYVGTSVVLKVAESWSDFPGEANIELGYKNTDLAGHVGVSLGLGPIMVDFRYTQGFFGQLVQDNTQIMNAKAEEPAEGTQLPDIEAKLTNFQLGAGFAF